MRQAFLEMDELTKHYRRDWTFRKVRALEKVSLRIEEGEVFGLIGHNGAGKTTTFKLLLGLLHPTHGRVLWKGRAVDGYAYRRGIGFSPEQPYFYDHLTVRETLDLYGQLYGMSKRERRERIAELAERMLITHKLDARIRTLSKGTTQRVAVAQAILHRPELAILDEPMSGLDPTGRSGMRDLILELKNGGTTVLFSSHILAEAEALCDRVGILVRGRLHDVVPLDHALQPPVGYTLVVTGVDAPLLEQLARLALEPPAGGPERWSVRLATGDRVRAALTAIQGTAVSVEGLFPERPTLEQRYLQAAQGVGALELDGEA